MENSKTNELSSELIEAKYNEIRKMVVSKYHYENLNDKEINVALTEYLKAYVDEWKYKDKRIISFKELILCYYYDVCLNTGLVDEIIHFCEENLQAGGTTYSLVLNKSVLEKKEKLNEKNREICNAVLDLFGLTVEKQNGQYRIFGDLIDEYFLVTSEFMEMVADDIFVVPSPVNTQAEDISKYHDFLQFNYDSQNFVNKREQKQRLIDDFAKKLTVIFPDTAKEEYNYYFELLNHRYEFNTKSKLYHETQKAKQVGKIK